MRKTISLVLIVLTTLLAMVPALADANPAYEFWGIPFGSDQATFIDTAKKKSGIEFAADNYYKLTSPPVSSFNLPAEITATFMDGLSEVIVDFDLTGAEMTDQERIVDQFERLATVYKGLKTMCGEPTGGTFRTGSKAEGTITAEELTEYNFPMIDGEPNFDVMQQAAIAEQMTVLRVRFSNILLLAEVYEDSTTRALTPTLSVLFWDTPMESSYSIGLNDYVPK